MNPDKSARVTLNEKIFIETPRIFQLTKFLKNILNFLMPNIMFNDFKCKSKKIKKNY